MKLIDDFLAKREIRKILNAKDSEKIESIREVDEDEKIEQIIFSIKDKKNRAKAFEQSIDKIDDKDVLKRIIPTLKDDDILKLLKRKSKYLNNDDINILYTTISGIVDPEKRIQAVDLFKHEISDIELSRLLESIKDQKDDNYFENKKIDIIANKIIYNYLNYGTVMHIRELLSCLQKEKSKNSILKKCFEIGEKIQKKLEQGEQPIDLGILFNKEGKTFIQNIIFKNIGKGDSLDKQKADIIMQRYKEGELDYEESRLSIENGIYSSNIQKEYKRKLLKHEARKIREDLPTDYLIEEHEK